ncbi:MAG: DEAD/DEAH box helicase [Gammaproteobacteria bacterium]|nr:DEAD/DEAH box helicase [Gammaproteobacteria bacterium]
MSNGRGELRPYQLQAVEDIRLALKDQGSAVYQLATGAGKTVVGGEVGRRVTDRGNQALFLVHRRELVTQTIDTIQDMIPGLSIGVEARGWPAMPWAPLQIGMVQTMVRRESTLRPRIIIVDEAHHVRTKSWETILGRYPDAWILGLTGTPQRLDGKGLGTHFRILVQGPTIPDLVGMGYLAPVRTLRLPAALKLSGVKKDRRGEYDRGEAQRRLDEKVIADTTASYLRYARGRRAMFFGITREHSRRVCASLRAVGVSAEHVDGDDHDSRRDRIMAGLRDGALDVVGNCDLISEGFDAPGCDCILMGSHTASVTRYLQQAGRAMRPHPTDPTREALILDLAGISHDLGLPDEIRDWSLEDGEVNEREKGKRILKTCPVCRTGFYGNRCKHCGHQLAAPMPDVAEVDTELEEATPTIDHKKTLRQQVGMCKNAPNPRACLEAIAKARKYKAGWVDHVLGAWERSGQLKEARR